MWGLFLNDSNRNYQCNSDPLALINTITTCSWCLSGLGNNWRQLSCSSPNCVHISKGCFSSFACLAQSSITRRHRSIKNLGFVQTRNFKKATLGTINVKSRGIVIISVVCIYVWFCGWNRKDLSPCRRISSLWAEHGSPLQPVVRSIWGHSVGRRACRWYLSE